MKKIVFVGRSNVGKSRTLRALTGRKVRVGRKPGVTRTPNAIPFGDLTIIDLPGFGFMSGVKESYQEEIKRFIVSFLENDRDILFAVQVIDASAFAEIARRWEKRGTVSIEVELFKFLNEVGLRPVLVANKIDKISRSERGAVLDEICELLGMLPPWRQWIDVIVPFSAKTGEGIEDLKKIIRKRKEVRANPGG